MNIWHLTDDAPRDPYRVSPGEKVTLIIGTWPIEPDQAVRVTYQVNSPPGRSYVREVAAACL